MSNALHREQADEALYNAVYTMFLEGAFAQQPAECAAAMERFVEYLGAASKDEVVSVLCTAFDQLVDAEHKLARVGERIAQHSQSEDCAVGDRDCVRDVRDILRGGAA